MLESRRLLSGSDATVAVTTPTTHLDDDGTVVLVITRTGDLSHGASVALDYEVALADGTTLDAASVLTDAPATATFAPGEEAIEVVLFADAPPTGDGGDGDVAQLRVVGTHAWTLDVEGVNTVAEYAVVGVDRTPTVTILQQEQREGMQKDEEWDDVFIDDHEDNEEEDDDRPGLNDDDGGPFRLWMLDRLHKEEGRRNEVYGDPNDRPTIGVGHDIRSDPAVIEEITGNPAEDYIDGDRELTEEEIDELLDHDYEKNLDLAKREVSNIAELDPRAQEAIVDFVSNHGSMAKFADMKEALERGDYRQAAWDMAHNNRSEDSAPSKYFDQFEKFGNDRARTTIKLLNEAADSRGQDPLFGWLRDADSQRPRTF